MKRFRPSHTANVGAVVRQNQIIAASYPAFVLRFDRILDSRLGHELLGYVVVRGRLQPGLHSAGGQLQDNGSLESDRAIAVCCDAEEGEAEYVGQFITRREGSLVETSRCYVVPRRFQLLAAYA